MIYIKRGCFIAGKAQQRAISPNRALFQLFVHFLHYGALYQWQSYLCFDYKMQMLSIPCCTFDTRGQYYWQIHVDISSSFIRKVKIWLCIEGRKLYRCTNLIRASFVSNLVNNDIKYINILDQTHQGMPIVMQCNRWGFWILFTFFFHSLLECVNNK